MPFADLVEKLVDYDKQIVDPVTGFVMTIEQVIVDLPVEVRVEVNEDGTVQVKGSPPTQIFETSIMPVFHRMKLRVAREDGE